MYQIAMTKAARERKKAVEAEAAVRQDRKQQAQAERERFEEKLLANTYKGFKCDRGIVAITVIPVAPPTDARIGPTNELRGELSPKADSIGEVVPELDSEVCHWPNVGERVAGIAEMTAIGSLYSVRNLLYISSYKPDEAVFYRFKNEESDFVRLVWKYITSLKRQNIYGPWLVGMSLLKVKNFQLTTSDNHNNAELRIKVENVRPDFATIPADVDLSKVDAIASMLKKPLWMFWRAFNLPGRPRFYEDGSGAWFGYEGRPT